MNIDPIPAFADNYLWCLQENGAAWIVDPGDAAPVRDFLQRHQLRLRGILITHHHPDHIGGVAELVAAAAPEQVVGPANGNIPALTRRLGEGDSVEVLGRQFRVMEVPGHTLDHLAYFCGESEPPLLFCGDTLFAGGCGRLFEGTPAQMHESLQRLAALPGATRVYCAHEYTEANLRFAVAVEPDNLALQQRQREVADSRRQGRPTLPSTLSIERDTNPFLRVDAPAVREAVARRDASADTPATRFANLRRWKDRF